MKKTFISLLIAAIILSFLPLQVYAEDTCTHTWSSWEVYNEPTCGETGEKARYCSNCYEWEYETIPATNEHEWSDWYKVKSATISKNGLKKRDCYICGKTQSKKISKLKPYVKLSKKNLKLKATKTYTLKIKYAKGDSIKKCKSSNTKIATVTKKGKIKAKRAGTAKITVILKSGKRATCKVRVTAKKKTPSSNDGNHDDQSNSGNNDNEPTYGTVYWTPNGTVYHSTKNCPTLSRSSTICNGSQSECPKPRACKVCY